MPPFSQGFLIGVCCGWGLIAFVIMLVRGLDKKTIAMLEQANEKLLEANEAVYQNSVKMRTVLDQTVDMVALLVRPFAPERGEPVQDGAQKEGTGTDYEYQEKRPHGAV
jgi:hypothetical protein